MEKLFEQLSVYEVLNNFLPDAFFCILFRWQTGVGYEVNDTSYRSTRVCAIRKRI